MRLGPARARLAWWALAGLLFAATFAIYVPGLRGPLVLDDAANLEPFQALASDAADIAQVFSHDSVSALRTRPLTMLTFAANWLTTGGDVFYLKLTNVVLHLLCGVTVLWLTARLMGLAVVGLESQRLWIALWVAAAWLLAPLLVSTVLYVVQRMAQLAALLVLCGLVCFVSGRERLEAGRPGSGIGLMVLAFAVFWPLATASKPNGALLPLLALLVELFFFAGANPVRHRRVAWLLTALALLPVAWMMTRVAQSPQWLAEAYAGRAFTPLERIVSQPRVLLDYAANMLMLPGGTPFGLYRDDYLPSRGLLSPPVTLLAWLILFVVLAGAWRTRGTRTGVLLFGPVFFVCAHAVESSFLPLEMYFEHRNYLPGVGLFMSLGMGVFWAKSAMQSSRAINAGMLLVCLSYAIASAARVATWQDRERLLAAEAGAHPASPRVHTELTHAALLAGDFDLAFRHLARADELDRDRPTLGAALHYLVVYCASGRAIPGPAYRRLDDPRRRIGEPYTESVLRWLTARIEAGECASIEAERVSSSLARAALRGGATGSELRYVALLHFHAASWARAAAANHRAFDHLAEAGRLLPGWVEPALLEVRYRLEDGDMEGAGKALETAQARLPSGPHAYVELVDHYARLLAAR